MVGRGRDKAKFDRLSFISRWVPTASFLIPAIVDRFLGNFSDQIEETVGIATRIVSVRAAMDLGRSW